MNPKVTIITVCRNSERTIENAIRSVLSQTYRNIEYLIIDGLSNDSTLEIVRSFEPKFQGRMKIISEKDAGIYDAMNKGIALASGEIIGMINSDDWYEEIAVESLVGSYEQHGEGVYYGILRCLENGQEVMLKSVNHRFLHQDHIGHPAYFVSKAVYDKYGTFRLDYRFASDFELMLRFIRKNVPFFQINQIVANYTYGGESSKQEKNTYEEYYRIRYEYGYLSRKGLFIRIAKNRLMFFLKSISLFKN